MIELEHSPLGGSAAKRFMTCGASFLLQREQIENGQFENNSSVFSELGTAAHELAALCLKEGKEPFEYLGQDFNGFKVGWPDGITLDAVQVYANECRSIMDICQNDGRAIIEETFKRPDVHPLFKGTVDFGYISPSRGIFLRDYKNGAGVGVDAVDNEQLLYYAALLIFSNPETIVMNTPVNLGIVQPNFYGIYEDVDIWATDVNSVVTWLYEKLLPKMDALYNRRSDICDADYVSGDHCQFCPVMLSCKKLKQSFLEYTYQEESFAAMLTNEELDFLYAQRENARRFMHALEGAVHARLMTGSAIPSAKLVEKQTARVWKPGAVSAIEAELGEKVYKPREPLSPAGLEKLSSRGKQLALEYGYKLEGSLTVAPRSDRRPEAKPATGSEIFAHIAVAQRDEF